MNYDIADLVVYGTASAFALMAGYGVIPIIKSSSSLSEEVRASGLKGLKIFGFAMAAVFLSKLL